MELKQNILEALGCRHFMCTELISDKIARSQWCVGLSLSCTCQRLIKIDCAGPLSVSLRLIDQFVPLGKTVRPR